MVVTGLLKGSLRNLRMGNQKIAYWGPIHMISFRNEKWINLYDQLWKFVEKLSIYIHSSVFFTWYSCTGFRKNYICIEFG